jgi:hypothetical protein
MIKLTGTGADAEIHTPAPAATVAPGVSSFADVNGPPLVEAETESAIFLSATYCVVSSIHWYSQEQLIVAPVVFAIQVPREVPGSIVVRPGNW